MKCPICEKRQEYLDILNDIKSDFEKEKARTNFCVLVPDGTLEVMEIGYVELLNECPNCGVDEETIELFRERFRFRRKTEQLNIDIEKHKKDIRKLKEKIVWKKQRNFLNKEPTNTKLEEDEVADKEKEMAEAVAELKKLDLKKAHIIVSTKVDSFDGKKHHHECVCGKRWPEEGSYNERFVDDSLEG